MIRVNMEALFQEIENSVAAALRIRTEFIRTELELGFTFLDIAKSKGPPGSQASLRHAVAALHAVDLFLRTQPGLNDVDRVAIYLRRNELRQRLQGLFAESRAGAGMNEAQLLQIRTARRTIESS
jgi:hypothetical protein